MCGRRHCSARCSRCDQGRPHRWRSLRGVGVSEADAHSPAMPPPGPVGGYGSVSLRARRTAPPWRPARLEKLWVTWLRRHRQTQDVRAHPRDECPGPNGERAHSACRCARPRLRGPRLDPSHVGRPRRRALSCCSQFKPQPGVVDGAIVSPRNGGSTQRTDQRVRERRRPTSGTAAESEARSCR